MQRLRGSSRFACAPGARLRSPGPRGLHEYAAENVFLAVDGRITEGVPLLVTTNLTLDALTDKFPEPFGPSIASRLAESCDAFLLEGADRRLEAAA